MIYEEQLKQLCISKLPIMQKKINNRNIWVYGAGIGGKVIYSALCEFNICVSGFVDKKAGEIKSLYDLPVVNIENLNPDKDYIIISLRRYEWEVLNTCFSHGFNEEDIYYLIAGEYYNKEDIIYKGCHIGRFTYGYDSLLEFYPIAESIGRFCSINFTAKIWNNYPIDYITTHPLFYPWKKNKERNDDVKMCGKHFNNVLYEDNSLRNNKPVRIGNDVWIGANTIILPGVNIGDGAVIAAGAVVAHDVEPYAIVGGIPARLIRYRFSKEKIEKLNQIKWWNWDIQKINDNIELFYNPDLFFDSNNI